MITNRWQSQSNRKILWRNCQLGQSRGGSVAKCVNYATTRKVRIDSSFHSNWANDRVNECWGRTPSNIACAALMCAADFQSLAEAHALRSLAKLKNGKSERASESRIPVWQIGIRMNTYDCLDYVRQLPDDSRPIELTEISQRLQPSGRPPPGASILWPKMGSRRTR